MNSVKSNDDFRNPLPRLLNIFRQEAMTPSESVLFVVQTTCLLVEKRLSQKDMNHFATLAPLAQGLQCKLLTW